MLFQFFEDAFSTEFSGMAQLLTCVKRSDNTGRIEGVVMDGTDTGVLVQRVLDTPNLLGVSEMEVCESLSAALCIVLSRSPPILKVLDYDNA